MKYLHQRFYRFHSKFACSECRINIMEQKISITMFRFYIILFSLLCAHNLCLADEWDENYERGVAALEKGDWDFATSYLQRAIAIRPDPEKQAATSSLKLIQYIPYYYLGTARFFSGNYADALNNFNQSLIRGAILKTSKLNTLVRLQKVCITLSQLKKNKEKSATEQKVNARLLEITRLILAQNYIAAEKELANSEIPADDLQFAGLRKWLAREKQILMERQASLSSIDEAVRHWRSGLDLFVQGRYQEAIRKFRLSEEADPTFANSPSWRKRTEAELDRVAVKQAPDTVFTTRKTIVERFIRQSTAPVFVFRTPNKSTFETRTSKVFLSGNAVDDQGIAFIDLVVNGQSIVDSAGLSLKLKPDNPDNAVHFAFEANVPLSPGENEIILTAYDVDSISHRAIERFVITRNPAFYRTGGFMAIAAITLAFATGGVFLSRYIKYRIAIVNKYNPYIAGAPIRNEEMFFGRERLIKRILNTIHNNSLMIHGPRRIGKTSLQHQLHRRLLSAYDPDYYFVPVFIDLQGTDEQHFFLTLMEEIVEVCQPKIREPIACRLQKNKENYTSRDMSHDLRLLLQTLQKNTSRILKLVLLIDEVDELNKYSEQANQRLRSIFMKTFAENLVAVMSGAFIRKKWESEGSPWYNFFEEIEVPPLNKENAEQLIKKPVHGIFDFEEAAVDKILEYTACRPYDIQKVCVHVINRIIEDKRRHATMADVDEILPNVTRSFQPNRQMEA